MKNIFDQNDTQEFIDRINNLNSNTEGQWGKMSVGQMLAHCNVAYELAYENNHPRPNAVKRYFLKLFVKQIVVSETPYKKNSRTAPEFLMTEAKDFETEKKRLVDYLHQTQELGTEYFDGKESHGFGALNKTEWNNLFSKHLDHHLTQFGV